MSMQTQGSPRLRIALPALALATAASILALAPTISIAAEPMKHEAGAAMEMNEPKMRSMMEAHHARLHEQMAIEYGKMHPSMPMAGGMPMTGGMPMAGGMPMHGMSHTGDVDHDFAANMRRHHEMGVRMAQAQIKDGRDAEMTRVARDIVAAQQAEISVLDRWLSAHELAASRVE